jgi:hypothetical protein
VEIKGFEELTNEVNNELKKPAAHEAGNTAVPMPKIVSLDDVGDVVDIYLFENNDKAVLKDLSIPELLRELLRPFTMAMGHAGINSLCTDIFGYFLGNLDIIPENYQRVPQVFCGKNFFVLKNASREALVYKQLTDAARFSEGDTVSFPLVTRHELQLVTQLSNPNAKKPYTVPVDALTFTPDEIKWLQFSFITNAKITYVRESVDPYKDAVVVFGIDRVVLDSMPYSRE